MKKYFTDSKFDPASDDYDSSAVKPRRPLHSDNDEMNALRQENFSLRKQLAEYKANDPEPTTSEVESPDNSRATVEVKELSGDSQKPVDISDIVEPRKASGDLSGGMVSKPKPAAKRATPAKASGKRSPAKAGSSKKS